MMGSILSVKDVCFGYGPIEVLCGVSFSVEKGDYLALAGPNGAGKTTLVKVALGLVSRTRGAIELFGRRLEEFDEWGRIGYLPQRITNFNPLFPATVREVIGLGLLSQKRFPKRLVGTDHARIRQALELMSIPDLKDKLVGELSGGQQQRVFLARAMVCEPELLILDEPSTALDSQSREGFFDLMQRLNRERGITIILISHDTTTVGRYANKLLYLDKQVVFCGPFTDFCEADTERRYPGVCPAERGSGIGNQSPPASPLAPRPSS